MNNYKNYSFLYTGEIKSIPFRLSKIQIAILVEHLSFKYNIKERNVKDHECFLLKRKWAQHGIEVWKRVTNEFIQEEEEDWSTYNDITNGE